MMRLLIVCTLFGLSSCASQPTIDPMVAPFVDQFIGDAKAHGITELSRVTVTFGPVQKHPDKTLETVGQCEYATWRHQIPRVTINATRWSHLSELERKTLIYHELGHCLLGLGHGTGVMQPRVHEANSTEINNLFQE